MPIGHGNRIVKPRSAKQKAQAAQYRNAQASLTNTASATVDSWWTKPRSREAFDAAAAKELARMALSTFGSNKLGGGTVG